MKSSGGFAVLLVMMMWIPTHAQTLANPFVGNQHAAEEGGKTFAISCAPCHGIHGEGAQGQSDHIRPPDLTRGVFKSGGRDEDLFRTISDGIAAGGMPSFAQLGNERIWQLVTFVRTLSRGGEAPPGNPENGEGLYWGKGNCGSCHAVGSKGVSMGPDLARGGRRMTADKVKQAIVAPSEDVSVGYEVIVVVTKEGEAVSGLARFFDNYSCRLIDSSGKEHTFLREDVRSMNREMRSLMPDNYGRVFSEKEIDDLVAYIFKLRREAILQ